MPSAIDSSTATRSSPASSRPTARAAAVASSAAASAARVREQPRAARRRAHGVLQALEERAARGRLEGLDLVRERRLRDDEPARRRGERALLDDRHVVGELPERHEQILWRIHTICL
jgi:hypothetical protein